MSEELNGTAQDILSRSILRTQQKILDLEACISELAAKVDRLWVNPGSEDRHEVPNRREGRHGPEAVGCPSSGRVEAAGRDRSPEAEQFVIEDRASLFTPGVKEVLQWRRMEFNKCMITQPRTDL
jgi:hypothetical protein